MVHGTPLMRHTCIHFPQWSLTVALPMKQGALRTLLRAGVFYCVLPFKYALLTSDLFLRPSTSLRLSPRFNTISTNFLGTACHGPPGFTQS